MMMTLRQRGLLLALALAAACGARAAGKDTLIYCSEATPESLNPQQATTGPSLVASSQTMFNRLISHDLRHDRLLPSLATAWTVSADSKTYTFTLRRGVKFNRNKYFTPTRDFNADDVIFSLQRQRDAANPLHGLSGGVYEYFHDTGFDTLIREVKKLDDYRVQFILTRPNAAFLADWAMDFTTILSAEYGQAMLKQGTPERLDSWPIGTGPYALQQYRPDAQIRYIANPHYWGGEVATKHLIFAITPDPQTRLAKLRAGECQIIPSPLPSQLKTIADDPQLRLRDYPSPNVGYLAFNTQKKPFDDPRVRQALNYATDKAAIARWCDSGYDARVSEAARLSDTAARARLYREAQQIFYRQAPWIALASGRAFYATRSNLVGFDRELMGSDFSKARLN